MSPAEIRHRPVGSKVEVSAVALSDVEDKPCFGFAIRNVEKRLASAAASKRELPRSVAQLTELIGRVPLRDLVRETHLQPANFILPLFVVEGEGIRTWELLTEAGAETLVVDLLKGVTANWRLTIETEKSLGALPATVKVEVAGDVVTVQRAQGTM